MTTRSFIIAIGCLVAAYVFINPPTTEVNAGSIHWPERTTLATDTERLFRWLMAITIVTFGAWVVAGERKRKVVDADSGAEVVRR